MTINQAFENWMLTNQRTMESALSSFLPIPGEAAARLIEAMRYTTLEGGKRVRPALVFAAGSLVEADPALLLRAACAVELIHVYSLVHDDMPCMDDDMLRRGKPTVHVKYDEATALLVGDALQAQAFAVLADGEGDPARKLAQVRLLAQAAGAGGMCGGQAIDLASVGQSLTLPALEQMHRLKTGALLRASVFLGALCGRTLTASEESALDDYAKAIGLAFQVVDDILDATAESSSLGKTAGKDAADNKPTYVTILGLDASRQLADRLLAEALAALVPFGDKADRLRQIAEMIVRRNA